MEESSALEQLGQDLSLQAKEHETYLNSAQVLAQKAIDAVIAAINIGKIFVADSGEISYSYNHGPVTKIVSGEECVSLSDKYLSELNRLETENNELSRSRTSSGLKAVFTKILFEDNPYERISYYPKLIPIPSAETKEHKKTKVTSKIMLVREYTRQNYQRVAGSGSEVISTDSSPYQYESEKIAQTKSGVTIISDEDYTNINLLNPNTIKNFFPDKVRTLYEFQDLFMVIFNQLNKTLLQVEEALPKIAKSGNEEFRIQLKDVYKALKQSHLEQQAVWNGVLPSEPLLENLGSIVEEFQAQLKVLQELDKLRAEIAEYIFRLVDEKIEQLQKTLSLQALEKIISFKYLPVVYGNHRWLGLKSRHVMQIPIAHSVIGGRQTPLQKPPLKCKTLLGKYKLIEPQDWQATLNSALAFLVSLADILTKVKQDLKDETKFLRPLVTKSQLKKSTLNF